MLNRSNLAPIVNRHIAKSIAIIALLLLGTAALQFEKLKDVWQATDSSAENTLTPELIVLRAENHDGKDEVWQARHYYGKRTWGIRASGKPEAGAIWFNAFPGDTGEYVVTLYTVLEHDGQPKIQLRAAGKSLFEGSFPYHEGYLDCDKRGAPGSLPLGTHQITKGEKIELIGTSVYECGKQGAYALWYELRFTPKS